MILRQADQNLVNHLKDLVILYCTLPWLKLERMLGGWGGGCKRSRLKLERMSGEGGVRGSMQKTKVEVREHGWRRGDEGKHTKGQD